MVFYTVESVFIFIRACSTIFKASCTVIPSSYCVRWDVYFYSPVQMKTELKQRNKMIIQNYTQEESGLELPGLKTLHPYLQFSDLSTYWAGSSDSSVL